MRAKVHLATSLEFKLAEDTAAGLSIEGRRGLPEEVHLEKRACDYNGCKCKKGSSGQYCGLCPQVTDKGDSPYWTGYSFQCDSDKKCCAYGKTTHCAAGTYSDWCPR